MRNNIVSRFQEFWKYRVDNHDERYVRNKDNLLQAFFPISSEWQSSYYVNDMERGTYINIFFYSPESTHYSDIILNFYLPPTYTPEMVKTFFSNLKSLPWKPIT